MSPKIMDQLLAGSHTLLGMDQSMVMFQPEIEVGRWRAGLGRSLAA